MVCEGCNQVAELCMREHAIHLQAKGSTRIPAHDDLTSSGGLTNLQISTTAAVGAATAFSCMKVANDPGSLALVSEDALQSNSSGLFAQQQQQQQLQSV